MRASVLSDDRVIQRINTQYIPATLNVTKSGFPTDILPVIASHKFLYHTNPWLFPKGYANFNLIDPNAKYNMGSFGPASSNMPDHCNPVRFLQFLDSCDAKYAKILDMNRKFQTGQWWMGLQAAGELINQDLSKLGVGFGDQFEVLKQIGTGFKYTGINVMMDMSSHGILKPRY